MKQIKYISVMFLAIVLLQSCKKDCHDPRNPECENYDPCIDEVETSADFLIYQAFQITPPEGWENIDADTTYHTRAMFEAVNKNYDYYEWQIGSETIIGETKVQRNMFPENEFVDIKLKVRNDSPNTACFPQDTRTDSLTRTFFSMFDLEKAQRWEGTFEGSYDFAPDEKHIFTLNRDSNRVNGLPYNECRSEFDIQLFSYISISFVVRRLFAIPDEQQPALRCKDGFLAFMYVDDNNNFELKIIGSNSNPSLGGAIMRGKKIN